MRYFQMRETDIANGEGIRVSIFVQGCEFQCEGCFNSPSWNFTDGKEFNDDTIDILVKLLKRPHIKGLSILGGEPMHDNNYVEVGNLMKKIKLLIPEKNIWVYSGFTYEQLEGNKEKKEVLKSVDVLVDGLFIEELKDPSLQFRGSSNQRVIKVKDSLQENRIVLYN